MLDQPVPNPIAKNPNIYTHKVFAAIGLILIGTIVAVAGIWWYVQGQDKNSGTEDTTVTTKVATTSAKTATVSASKDGLKTLQSSIGFTIKYPEAWLTKSCGDSALLFAPTKSTLGVCDSDSLGPVAFTYFSDMDYQKSYSENLSADISYLANSVRTTTSVDGKGALKISGVVKEDTPGIGVKGVVIIRYIVNLNGKALNISYRQNTSWIDVSQEFEEMVASIQFL